MDGQQQVEFGQATIDAVRADTETIPLPNFSPLAWYCDDQSWSPALIVGTSGPTTTPETQVYDLKVFSLQVGYAALDVQATIGRARGQFIPCDLLAPVLGVAYLSGQGHSAIQPIKDQAMAVERKREMSSKSG